MKKTVTIAQAVILVVSLALGSVPRTMAEKPVKENRTIKVEGATPEHPVVSLGKAFDKKSGQEIEGYAIVHFAKNASASSKPTAGSTCYGYLPGGAKWKNVEPWVIDPLNTGELGPDFVLLNMTKDIAKWEDAADGTVGDSKGVNILGDGALSAASIIPSSAANDRNEVTFAHVDTQGAIAVTYVWGIFSGPTVKRQLVEWDQVYNTDYAWSATGEAGKMDFENIATHELGHAVGMADLYTSGCAEETMYGYADYAQTNKQDLNGGDILGINLLY
jgi:hypothetical protein